MLEVILRTRFFGTKGRARWKDSSEDVSRNARGNKRDSIFEHASEGAEPVNRTVSKGKILVPSTDGKGDTMQCKTQ